MPIRVLPPTVVNRIAAGEVVERPASAVKELVENAIDAGATRIEVTLRDGGRSLISVTDDGCGMSAEELALAVERHATSKLPDDDLTHIATLGFRGEALPSIGAVGRLTITSRRAGSDSAWMLAVEGGAKGAVQPAALAPGTRVEVRDLFYATPARLKFLKAERTEVDHVEDAVKRLAMAHPEIAFTLTDDAKPVLRLGAATADLLSDAAAARLARLAQVMGRDFADNALQLDAEREGVRLTGYTGLPTLNRAHVGAAVSLRQRPAGARPAAARRRARRLSGFPRPRPPSAGGAVPRAAGGRGRRQRPSGQGRGALPRRRAGARPDRRRLQACAGRGRPSRRHDRGDGARSAASGRRGAVGLARRALRCRAASPRRPPRPMRRSTARPQLQGVLAPAARAAMPRADERRRPPTIRSAPRGRSCTRPTSWRRPPTASSSSTSTPPMSGSSMSA